MIGMRMGMGLGAAMQTVAPVSPATPTEGGILHNGYIYHIFEADGELEVLADVDVEYLIVGAGGKGADGNNTASGYGGGGGGAGGLLVGSMNLAQSIDPYFITIGSLGSDTLAFSLTAKGGGDGGGYMTNGNPGGSGGGAGGKGSGTLTGGSPTVGQGNAGGANDRLSVIAGGAGGGGYGSIGSKPIEFAGANGGNGFNLNTVWGLVNGIIGAQTVGVNGLFAGGGGGGARATNAVGAGGSGGGGAGGQQAGAISPTPGVANTGGGGGGGGANGSNTLGAIGGSGIVIVRYAI